MRSVSFAIITMVGLLHVQQSACTGHTGDEMDCDSDYDCPKCSQCDTYKKYCVFKKDHKKCPGTECQVGVCEGIGQCGLKDKQDGMICEGDSSKHCQDGYCVVNGDTTADDDTTDTLTDELPPTDGDAGVGDDPHMHGLRGQMVDWKGEDGAWYALISDSDEVHLSVRVTAPLPESFPDRQLITGVGIKYAYGHSLVIETKDPYTTVTEGCPHESPMPCLSDNALRITVDDEEWTTSPIDSMLLPGDAVMTAVNLPPQCQPFGGDLIWAETFARMTSRRLMEQSDNFVKWASTWASTTAAPSWCTKFLEEEGAEGALNSRSKHSVFRIKTPNFTVRLHHGTNHQGGEVLDDGRVLPTLEFWQMNLLLEWYNFNVETVTGMLGETMRPVYNQEGLPIMSGQAAMRGDIEDYRISGPLSTDFMFFHE